MPRVDFRTQTKAKSHDPIPEGQYLCCVADIEEQVTKRGDPMWKLQLVITAGPHARRRIFDRVVFSEAARDRLALFCGAFGIEPSGAVDFQPDHFLGKACFVTVQPREYTDANGETRTTSEVPYDGYRKAGLEDEESIPF